LQPLVDVLSGTERPASVTKWLALDTATALIREMAAGQRPVTHTALDELPDETPVRHLRTVLVAVGVLPVRDEYLVQVERWIAAAITAHSNAEEQHLLHRYGTWHLVRRLRRRAGQAVTSSQVRGVRGRFTAAASFLDLLAARGTSLADVTQGEIDSWLASDSIPRWRDAGPFVRWAAREKLTSVTLPTIRWTGPQHTIDSEARWAQARHLLHENTDATVDRVAGLLVLLYAQWPATISRLQVDDVDDTGPSPTLRLGTEPVVLAPPLDRLVLDLLASRAGQATIGDSGTSPWLFPGGRPGQPISANQLTRRLRRIGIQARDSRNAALLHLATELPAAVLARVLGLHINVAAFWQQIAGGDWTTYAADVAHRPTAERSNA
jgi:hypothetical protein